MREDKKSLPPAEQPVQEPAVEPAVGLRPHIAGGRDRGRRKTVGRREAIL